MEEKKYCEIQNSFENDYKEFLHELYALKCKNQEEQAVRWNKFLSYSLKKNFVEDARQRLNIEEGKNDIFECALKKAISTVQKKKLGNEFLKWLEFIYKGEKIQYKYKDFLAELAEKTVESRYEWFKNNVQHDQFILDILEGMNGGAYEKLKKRIKHVEESDEDFDVAYYGENKKIDSVIFMEVVQSLVRIYPYIDGNGNKWSVMEYMKKRYRQLAGKKTAEKQFCETPYPEVPKTYRENVLKLVYKAKHVLDSRGECAEEYSEAKMRDFMESLTEKGKDSAKIIDLAVKAVYCANLYSLDDSKEDDEGNIVTKKDLLSDKQDVYKEIEQREEEEIFSKKLGNAIANWQSFEGIHNKAHRQKIRIFLTRDILVVLKLRLISELAKEEQKNYKMHGLKPEPYCKSWCPDADTCFRKGSEGCYIRYMEMPPGDQSVFELLKKQQNAEKLYSNILNRKYLGEAFGEETKAIEDLLYKYLDKEFDFSNEKVAEILKVDPSSVSRFKKSYTETQKLLYDLFL